MKKWTKLRCGPFDSVASNDQIPQFEVYSLSRNCHNQLNEDDKKKTDEIIRTSDSGVGVSFGQHTGVAMTNLFSKNAISRNISEGNPS
ncbi:MAG: hypothetical protein ABSA83_15155 [Verrucomicrobiota bacterium]|jgi:hypothetical protein